MPDQDKTLPDIVAVLRHALQDKLNPEGADFLSLCADDVVLEFPFALPDAPKQIVGRDALQAYLGQLSGMIDLGLMSVPTVHTTGNPDTDIIEFSADAISKLNGRALTQDYIVVIRTANGRITHYRDYWNPLIALAATETEND